MMKDIEMEAIKKSLNNLVNTGIITEEQSKILLDIYKADDRSYGEVRKEITALATDKELLEKVLKRSKEAKGLEDVELKKEPERMVNLSLENITDFEKDGKCFIKVHYPYPIDEVRIIENRTNPYRSSKEIFESLKDKPWLTSLDGTSNATAIFEQILVKQCHEIDMKKAEEVSKVSEFEKLKTEEKEVVLGTLKTLISNANLSDEDKKRLNNETAETALKVLNKQVYISPEENIVVICEANSPEKDEVKTLKKEVINNKTKYSLTPLNTNGYRYDSDAVEEQKDTNSEFQVEEETDLDKEMNQKEKGYSKTLRRKKDVKPNAFINTLLISILSGFAFGTIIALILNLL